MDATSVIWTVVVVVIAALALSAGGWRLRRGRRDDRRDR